MPLFREAGIVEDPWQKLGDDAAVPADGMVLVSFTRWREARETRRAASGARLLRWDCPSPSRFARRSLARKRLWGPRQAG